MAFVRMLAKLLDHPELGRYIVPSFMPAFDATATFVSLLDLLDAWHGWNATLTRNTN